MGADVYQMTAVGKNADSAYRSAIDECRASNGHQDGYSGDIQTSNGFAEFKAPARLKVSKVIDWAVDYGYAQAVLEDPELYRPEELKLSKQFLKTIPEKHRDLVRRVARVINEKWGRAACFEITGKEAVEIKAASGFKGKQVKVFVFAGTGAC